MQEALKRAARGNPSSLVGQTVRDEVEGATEEVRRLERYHSVVREHRNEWYKACNQWKIIGTEYRQVDLNRREYYGEEQVEKVRQKAQTAFTSVAMWEIDGIAFLLKRLDDGLGQYTTGYFSNRKRATSNQGLETGTQDTVRRLPYTADAASFMDEITDLLGFSQEDRAEQEQLIAQSWVASQPRYNTGITVQDLFVPLARWVHARSTQVQEPSH